MHDVKFSELEKNRPVTWVIRLPQFSWYTIALEGNHGEEVFR
jgi:hypothetical protein